MGKSWLFRTHVLVRLFWILATGYGAFVVATQYTEYYLLVIWLTLFSILGVISLIRFTEKSYRAMGQFLISIKQSDFSTTYLKRKELSKEMIDAFETINAAFMSLRSENESNHQLLQTIVEHSGVPIITFDESTDDILLINDPATELLQIPHLTKLSALDKVSDGLQQLILSIISGSKILQSVIIRGKTYQLSIGVKKIILQNKPISMVILHDIESELDQKEIESWQKLIRVMTHEIKNSVIPISTLSEVIHTMLKDDEGAARALDSLDEEEQDDLLTGIRTIEKRSKGLVEFVTSYNDITKVPQPKPQPENLNELLEDLLDLESEELKKRGITVSTNFPPVAIVYPIDLQMIEQVIINLIKNAIEALENQASPTLKVSLLDDGMGKLSIQIADNGPGMDKETLDNIFVPFFTTKEKGSGIGLPLSRQIIRAHGGHLKVHSTAGKGTTIEIIFNL